MKIAVSVRSLREVDEFISIRLQASLNETTNWFRVNTYTSLSENINKTHPPYR